MCALADKVHFVREKNNFVVDENHRQLTSICTSSPPAVYGCQAITITKQLLMHTPSHICIPVIGFASSAAL
jgi:hypothetical protein